MSFFVSMVASFFALASSELGVSSFVTTTVLLASASVFAIGISVIFRRISETSSKGSGVRAKY